MPKKSLDFEFDLDDVDTEADEPSGAMHTCDGCGRVARWDDDWTWYGSIIDLDEGFQITKACSEDCKDVAESLYRERTYIRHGWYSNVRYTDETIRSK